MSMYYKKLYYSVSEDNQILAKELKRVDTINDILKEKINKAVEYIKHSQSYGTMAQVMPHLKPYVNGDDLLEILRDDNMWLEEDEILGDKE